VSVLQYLCYVQQLLCQINQNTKDRIWKSVGFELLQVWLSVKFYNITCKELYEEKTKKNQNIYTGNLQSLSETYSIYGIYH
jgi:hypothetical protein